MLHFKGAAFAAASSAVLLAACGGGGGGGDVAAPPPTETSLAIPAPGSLLPAATAKTIDQADCSAATLGTSVMTADVGEPVSAVTLNAPTWTPAAPASSAARTPWASAMPPVAMTGRSTAATIAATRSRVGVGRSDRGRRAGNGRGARPPGVPGR